MGSMLNQVFVFVKLRYVFELIFWEFVFQPSLKAESQTWHKCGY